MWYIFEYNKLKKDSTLVLLENNSKLGIILNGQNDVPFDNSVGGEATAFINNYKYNIWVYVYNYSVNEKNRILSGKFE